MKSWIVLLISVSLTSLGQLILKKGLIITGPIEKIGLKFFQMIISPVVIAGLAFAVLGWTAYMLALSKSELSYAYPIWGLTYVIVPLFSLYIFKESVSLLKISGLGFICLGVFLIAMNAR